MDQGDSMIGRSVERQDAWAKVLGESQYPGDLNLPGQVHMKVLSPAARTRSSAASTHPPPRPCRASWRS